MAVVTEQTKYLCRSREHCTDGWIDESTLLTKCNPRACRWLMPVKTILEKPESLVECPMCGTIYNVPLTQGVVFCSCGYVRTNDAFLEV